MDLGTVIKNNRKQKGQTQEEFAKACGITQTYLSQIEGNKKEPNLSTLKVISDELEIPLPVLFFMSIDSEDVPVEKKEQFENIGPKVKALISDFFGV
ncbi:helix-turn-helix transcriptional regulator [Fluviicola sp.]|jgi:transcriptional regulator with XRE-family HTH domain|uniref:helix-turn-helix domain-containing protein n=1 Tax=Fluviicola sp. TaxID=1917219 RepID=UPI002819777B|nr:helix-turn-helix transcriptional regulator [Fluviicola sp.]MDR0803061.1 helix-turn-helix transcriptional regulator [Fluviicola sp.]